MDGVIVWAGWIGGLAVGLYMLVQLWLMGQPLGASTGFGDFCALGSKHPFFRRGPYAERWGFRPFFTLGIPLGGALALATSPDAIYAPEWSYGALYDAVLPEALWARLLWMLCGGVAIGYGARMAGGCTSGHSIMGSSLLNPPSIVASVGFFVGGIVAAQLLFRVIS